MLLSAAAALPKVAVLFPQVSMNITKYIKYWLPVVLMMMFIYWMSTETFSSQNTSSFLDPLLRLLAPSLSPEDIDLIHTAIRKLAHVTEYMFLGVVLFRAFRSGSCEPRLWRWTSFSLFIVVVYAAGDEYHQSLLPTRTGSLVDVGIDTVGGFFGQCVSVLWYRCALSGR